MCEKKICIQSVQIALLYEGMVVDGLFILYKGLMKFNLEQFLLFYKLIAFCM